MNFITRLKIMRLLSRVIKLNEKAPEGVTYNFEYTGSTNEIDFVKFRSVDGVHYVAKRACSYIGKDYGATLEEIAEQISLEELKNA